PTTNWAGTDSFYVRVTDGYWSDTAKIKITVVNVPVAPSIVTQPQSLTRNVGQSATFSVTINADVNPAPTYQWRKEGTAISGATGASYAIGSVARSDSGSYTVFITNSVGSVTSSAAVLTVNYAPVITTQPQSQTLHLGQTATFTVAATGRPAPTYQWRKNGTVITSTTSATLTLSSPGIGDSGRYTVTVSNSVGSVVSDTARFYAKVKTMSAGDYSTLIVKTDGTLWGCGENFAGDLGDGTTTMRRSLRQVNSNVKNVAGGSAHTLILKQDGTLWGCGYNIAGQVGDGSKIDRHDPVSIPVAPAQVSVINAGGYESYMIISDGSLWGWGGNGSGCLGIGNEDNQPSPVFISSVSTVKKASAGWGHTLILRINGDLYACGNNSSGQLGRDSGDQYMTPIPCMTSVHDCATGPSFSIVSKTDGTAFAFGSNSTGQLGDGTTTTRRMAVQVLTAPGVPLTGVQKVAAKGTTSLFLKNNGELWGCGSDLDPGYNFSLYARLITSNVEEMSAGASHVLILKTDGTLWGYGFNDVGQLGDGTTMNRGVIFELQF
ncbi:MAG: immunoglobulin domain-containing protein, partial [Chitinispirillaceae bacterium]|nr:immunoglobulin domain-containing protein [Chitinispirillaceae bacterium]